VRGQQSNLLRDIARLVKRHPAREWTRLADLLDNATARFKLVLFLRGVAGLKQLSSQQAKSKRAVKSPTKKRELIDRLDLELSRLPIAEIRELARKRGLPFSMKDSKQRLIRKISTSTGSAPLVIPRAPRFHKESSSDYAQWAEIIMGKSKHKR